MDAVGSSPVVVVVVRPPPSSIWERIGWGTGGVEIECWERDIEALGGQFLMTRGRRKGAQATCVWRVGCVVVRT